MACRLVWRDGEPGKTIDSWSKELYWICPVIGEFPFTLRCNIHEIRLLYPNPLAQHGNLLGLDYLFLVNLE